jgi:tetratricopeptide (TPR) repeat protein
LRPSTIFWLLDNIAPSELSTNLSRASALVALRRHDEAVESYARAVALRPSYTDAWKSRGALLMLLRRPEEALECFEKVLALDANHSEALRNTAVIVAVYVRAPDAPWKTVPGGKVSETSTDCAAAGPAFATVIV